MPVTIQTGSQHDCLEANSRRVVSSERPAARRDGVTESTIDLYPKDLLTGSGSIGPAGDRAWWLAHTLPRQEKAVAASLLGRGVAFYVPLVTRKSLVRRRTRVAQIPLFPGYVFLCGSEEDRLSALKTNRLLNVQRVPDGEQLRRQLLRFWELIALGAPLVREARLVAGEHVRVKAGPFQGAEGVVLRRNGRTELLIAIDFLQQGAALEIEDCWLEPV